MSRFALQRQIPGLGSTPNWLDAETFDTREKAQAAKSRDDARQKAEINGWGGSGYTMMRPQPTRVIEILAMKDGSDG